MGKTCQVAADQVKTVASVVIVATAVIVVAVVIVAGATTVVVAVIAADAATVMTVVIVASVATATIVQIVASAVVRPRHQVTQSQCRSKTSLMLNCVVTSATWAQVVRHVATADTLGRTATPTSIERASTGNRDWLFCIQRLRSFA